VLARQEEGGTFLPAGRGGREGGREELIGQSDRSNAGVHSLLEEGREGVREEWRDVP